MLFTFKLLNVKCNSVLSSEDSMWGKKDGLRVFFIVLNASGFRRIVISGREFPEPDVVDNFSVTPGKFYDLQLFPPLKGADWQIDPVDVGETDTVSIAVVGINEGLPYVAGGGGFDSGTTITGMEELSKKMSDEAIKDAAIEAGAAAGLSVAFKVLEEFIEELNKLSDCRGVAFAFEVGLSMKRLFQDHMNTKRSTVALNDATAANALHIVALSKRSADCGNPDYEVQMEIERQQQLALEVENTQPLPRNGPPRSFDAAFAPCKKGREIYVWPTYFDRTITITPSVPKYATLHPTWKIDDTVLPDVGSNSPLSLSKQVWVPVESRQETRNVEVGYEVVTTGASHQLKLRTRGVDGNYPLRVSLSYKFDDNGPWVLFREEELSIVGQGMGGDQAYVDYLSCLEHYRRAVTKYVAVHRLIRPGSPVEDITRFEHDLLAVARMFAAPPARPMRGKE